MDGADNQKKKGKMLVFAGCIQYLEEHSRPWSKEVLSIWVNYVQLVRQASVVVTWVKT